MEIVSLPELRMQLGLLDGSDETMLRRQLLAAHRHVERLLGFTFAEIEAAQGAVPEPLAEAVLQLAAWWYEQREAAVAGASAMEAPFGVRQIVHEYREFTF